MEKSSFFNSVAGDRKYDASMFAAYFNSFVSNGVFPNPGTNLQVIANSDMTVTVSIGKGWVNGYFYMNDAVLILPIDVADGILKRIDRIVLQFNTVARSITAKVKKGTFASTPVAPVLQRDADAYELALGDVYIGAGVISITQVNITDQRMNTAVCGWVNSLIQADTTAIFNQYQAWFTTQSGTYNTEMIANEATFQAQFDAWFATIQDMLSGDIAGNLAAQIIALEGVGWTNQTVKGNADAQAAHQADIVTIADPNKIPRAGITGLLDDSWMRLTRINSILLTQNSAQIDVFIPAGFKKLRVWFSGRTVDAVQPDLLADVNNSGTFLLVGRGGKSDDTIPAINTIDIANSSGDNKPFMGFWIMQAAAITTVINNRYGVFLITNEINTISFKCGTSIKAGSVLIVEGVR